MKKTFLTLVLCIALVFSSVAFAADREVTVMVNGNKLVSDVAPQLVNSRTMLPMRAIFESLGATVNWVESNQLIIATKDDAMITLQIGTAEMSVQKIADTKNNVIELDVAPYLHNSRTMVPARAIAEALGAKVEWDDATWTVTITQ